MALKKLFFRIIEFLEKDRFNLLTGALWLTFVVFVRFVLEFTFFSENTHTHTVYFGSFYNVYHQFAFYLVMFAFGVLIITFFTNEKPKKVANLVLLAFPLILMAPLIDKFIFNRTKQYYYALPRFYLENLQSLFLHSRLAPGLAVQLVIIVLLASLYVFIKVLMLNPTQPSRRIIQIGVLKSLATLVSLYFIMGIMGTLPVLVYEELRETGYFTGFSLQLITFIWLFILGTFIFMIMISISKRRAFRGFKKRLKVFWIIYFVVLACLGVMANGVDLFNSNTDDALVHVNDAPYAIVALMTVASSGVFAIYISKVKFSITNKKKRVKMSINETSTGNYCKKTALFIAYTSLGLSLLLGQVSAFLTLTFLILMFFYTLSLKKSRIKLIRIIIAGVASCSAFFIGFFTTNSIKKIFIGNYKVLPPITTAQPTISTLVLGIAIILISTIFWYMAVEKRLYP